jgi:glycosyltransferase EpsJ
MTKPIASIVVPCRNAAKTVDAAIASVLASSLRDVEILAVDDGSTDGTADVLARWAARDERVTVLHTGGRGVSAARNAALAAARGEFVFFVDADDTVEPEFFPRAIDAMRRDGADYCRVAYDEISATTGERRVFPLKRDYRFASNAEIVERFVPCFYGYSFANVRDWYRGTPLFSNREMGTVWSGAFRLDLIRANGIRFDETIEINEDAIFLCAYLLVCRRTTAVNEVLYHYTSAPTGSLRTKSASPRFFANKERMLVARRRLDSASGGRLAAHYQASCVFSLLEILAGAFRFNGCLGCGLAAFRRYGRDPAVRAALRKFPLSGRKPVLAVAVLFCRLFFPSRTGEQFLIK